MRICARDDCDNEVVGQPNKRYCSSSCRVKTNNKMQSARVSEELAAERAGTLNQAERASKLGAIAALLEEAGVDVEDVGSVKSVRVNKWQAVKKGAVTRHPESGRVLSQDPSEVVDLQAASIVLTPTWEEGPKWPLIQPAPPAQVNVQLPERFTLARGWKTALLLPDPQFGYRRDIYTGAKLDPFHDERALDVALQIAQVEQPDLTIWLGDVLDFAPFGKYRQDPGFALTVQPTLDAAHEWLLAFLATSDETRFIEGNHDARLQNAIIDNAKAAFGLKRAGAPPEEWPVLSVPYLLNFEENGIQYVGGYPSGATYINDNLAAIHGRKVGNDRRSAATMVVEDERVSVVFGHVHRIETTYRTRNTRGVPKISVAHTPGCLCRIDGAVPSVKSGTDAFGRAITSWENWQNGLSVVRYQEGDGKFAIETVPIVEGWAIHAGQEFTSRIKPDWVAS